MLLLLSGCSLLLAHAAPSALTCPRGSYWDGSHCSRCPGGTFGSVAGLTAPSCSGHCASGFFCPAGSTSAAQNECGASTYYCPPGSAMRQRVDLGFYTTIFPRTDSTKTVRTVRAGTQTRCEPGFYCVHGIRRKCRPGVYGNSSGLTTADCSGLCPTGHYCPEGTADPLPCPAGTYGDQLGLATDSCSALCPIGHYCPEGAVAPGSCPPGSFGASQGLKTKHCSSQCSVDAQGAAFCIPSPCPAGFYCPLATTTPVACGSIDVFCPEGSSNPTSVALGSYTVWTDDVSDVDNQYVEGEVLAVQNATTRTDQRVCEAGSYCGGGIKRLCPAGTYGDTLGLSTPQCSGPCPAGFYCPIGTSDYYRYPCLQRTAFCPQGSAAPTQVSPGYYTTTMSPVDVLVAQQICPQGSYCVNGVKFVCPAGTYGVTTGLDSPLCSGRCQDGCICAAGSVSATAMPCPAGQYSRNGVACSPCFPGYWCSAGSPDPKQNECGSDNVYCPLGSSAPLNVQTGYYAVGQTPTTHTDQVQCTTQTVAHISQCPSRTIGVKSDL